MIVQSPLLIFVAVVSAFFVGLSKGGLPTVGNLAVPLLALVISPVAAAALLLPIYVASDMVGLALYRRTFSKRNLAILVPSSLVGVLIGWAVSSRLSSEFVGMMVGIVGVAFCLNKWIWSRNRSPARGTIPAGLFWGAMTGITSFVSHSGGPTFQIYVLPQYLQKMTFAGTSTILFAILNAAKIVPYWEMGQFTGIDMTIALWLAPSAGLGTMLGKRLTEILPEKVFFRVIEVTLLLISAKLIADYVLTGLIPASALSDLVWFLNKTRI
ncbi:hypothetical protein CO661_24410 [Sinorhizobium fredii]|uniref:Probable membrane transporter protein n=1 Tax=Rhizobium fredii TaxID=380 RepID=A0A2A6LRN7_RHIFR|nr:sulfite exporter TauE/SafE family protein [Sinorhizobium fredii]PDT45201.1 hypothetical protein CO661_24410 [Sinorhizobium fredii]